jgi:CRP-like cAMP-binding protein
VSGSPVPRATGSRIVRRLTLVSLTLTLVAMLLGLLFIFHTDGGTLFLFSAVAPVLVFAAVIMFLVTLVLEFRQAHKLFSIERYPEGSTIFRQGDPGDCAYFLREGTVEVIDEDAGAVLTTLGAGEFFGEIALISSSPRSATIRTLSSVEVAVLGKDNFLNMMHLMPATEEEILNTVQTRIIRDAARRQESRS